MAPGNVRERQFIVTENGDLTQNVKEQSWKSTRLPTRKPSSASRVWTTIRTKVRGLLFSQTEGIEEADLKKKQADLLKTYKGFVKKYGPLNNPVNRRLFSE